MSIERLVITGIGVVSPIGIGKDLFWQSLKEGRSGIKPITLFDVSQYNVKIGGEISDFDPSIILGKRGLLDLDRSTKLLLCAAKLALDDAGLEVNEENSSGVGVSVGTTLGSLNSISKFDQASITDGPRHTNPSHFLNTVVNAPASRVGIKFKIKGFNSTLSTGMCSAVDALGYACDFIRLNRVHAAMVGAVEDLSIQVFLGSYKLQCLSGVDGHSLPISCPFDQRRNGIVLSEGAVTFMVEKSTDALKRKARIDGEVLGIASCFKGQGMAQAMRMALKNAELNPDDIDCIFANANSTRDADRMEVKAIKEVFGEAAKRILVTSVKSNIGESFAVSGGFSLAAALGVWAEGFIPSLINYEQADSECDLNFVLKDNKNNKASSVSRIMVNTFSPHGANSVLIIGKSKQ